MEKRNNSLDLLRILATFSVILIHINAAYSNFAINIGSFNSIVENVLNIILRFSVPCFVMMSGTLMLNNPKNRSFRYFYAKTFYKLGIPLVITLLFLLFVSEVLQFFGEHNYLSPFRSILIGDYYNLWYMFMIMGIYFLVPFVIRIKEILPRKVFSVLSVVWLILGIISQSTSEYLVSYSFGVVFSYLGYFLIGFVIYDCFKEKSSVLRIVISALSVAVLTALTFAFRWLTGFGVYVANPYRSFFSPAIVLISICVFTIFISFKTKVNTSKLSNKTFYIYLVHTFCYSTILTLIKKKVFVNEILTIIIVAIITFFISWLASTIYIIIWNWLEKKFNLREKYNKLIFK